MANVSGNGHSFLQQAHYPAKVLDAVRRLPICPDRSIKDVDKIVSVLACTVQIAANEVRSRRYARRIAPAPVSKQLELILRLTKNLGEALLYLEEARDLIENHLQTKPPLNVIGRDWIEHHGGPLLDLHMILVEVEIATEEARRSNAASAPARRGRIPHRGANWVLRDAANAYEQLTGKKASRSSRRFQAFVEELFDIGGINANADRRSRAMAEKRPKFSI
jgi:hypothetical protein